MVLTLKTVLVMAATLVWAAEGRVFGRCKLARELLWRIGVPAGDVATWVCIAQHESNFNTAAVNTQSGDHGIFQISQLWWCSPPGQGRGCGQPCWAFEDDDIADDTACVLHIKQVQGFRAWVAYNNYCYGDNSGYINDCF